MTRASDLAKLLGAGATILDGTTISTADNTDQLTLTSTDADANTGPILKLLRDSGSPADNDLCAVIKLNGDNDANEDTQCYEIRAAWNDVSNGTEDGAVRHALMVGGTLRDVMTLDSGTVVFNEDSQDINFRVESNGDANMLFVDGGGNRIYIGRNTSDGLFNSKLQIESSGSDTGLSMHRNGGNPYLAMSASGGSSLGDDTAVADDAGLGTIYWSGADGTDRATGAAYIAAFVDATPGANDMPGRLVFATTADGSSSPTERMRINSSGNLTVGSTSADSANVGARLKASGRVDATTDGGVCSIITRLSNDGDLVSFKQGTTSVGAIGSNSGANMIIGTGDTGLYFNAGGDAIHPWNIGSNAARDNNIDLGRSGDRFQTLFATTSSINTSDKNEKQDIEELTDVEKRVAVVAKSLLRKYRWKDAVAKKGDKARIHFGIISQDLQDAFTAESLDASRYGMFCSDTWWEKEISVDAVEAKDAVYKEVTDSDGNKTNEFISAEVEAQDAYTYIDTKQEATTGYTEKTRLGVRYSELLAFIISAI